MKRLLTAKARRALPGLENPEDIAQIKKTGDKNKNGLTLSHKEHKGKNLATDQRNEKQEVRGKIQEDTKDIGHLSLVTVFVVSAGGFVRGVTFPRRTQPLHDGSHFILSRLQ